MGGNSNIRFGAKEDCQDPEDQCDFAFPPSPAPSAVQIYLCEAQPGRTDCNGAPHQSQSFLTSAQSMQWVVEVSYPNDLDIRFEWDRTDVPQDINLWIVDSQGRIDMKFPPPDIPPFPLSILSGDDARAFLICGQTPGAGICPNTWP